MNSIWSPILIGADSKPGPEVFNQESVPAGEGDFGEALQAILGFNPALFQGFAAGQSIGSFLSVFQDANLFAVCTHEKDGAAVHASRPFMDEDTLFIRQNSLKFADNQSEPEVMLSHATQEQSVSDGKTAIAGKIVEWDLKLPVDAYLQEGGLKEKFNMQMPEQGDTVLAGEGKGTEDRTSGMSASLSQYISYLFDNGRLRSNTGITSGMSAHLPAQTGAGDNPMAEPSQNQGAFVWSDAAKNIQDVSHKVEAEETVTGMKTFDNFLMEQISSKIGMHFTKDGLGRATIDLDPPSLGRLKVEILVNDKMITASITAEHPAVKEVIEVNLQGLKNALMHQGLLVDGLAVFLNNNGSRNFREAPWSGILQNKSETIPAEGDDAGYVLMKNADGTIDIFI